MNTNIPNRYVKTILGALIVIFLLLCLLFIREYDRLVRLQLLGSHRFFSRTLIHRPLTSTDVTMIQSWMTFDYINNTFHLPANFLETQLTITDAHYPYISLSKYARTNKINSVTFLGEVQDAVRSFLTAQ